MVPMAPSTTRIRSVERSSLNGCICYCKKKSRAKQRGTSNPFEVGSGLSSDYPSCLAGYFAWPQVALTHHVFIAAYTLGMHQLSRRAFVGGGPRGRPQHYPRV